MKKIITLILVFTTTLLFSQVPNYVPTNGLVGWWPFTGNANDLSANGNHGVINGAILTTDRNGVENSAYKLENLSNNLLVNNIQPSLSSSNMSVSLWLKLTQWNYSTLSLIKNGIPYMNGFAVLVDQNDTTFGTNNYSVIFIVGNSIGTSFISNQSELGLWSNIVSTYDGNNIKVYLNGILKASQPFTQSLNSPNGNLVIGSWDNPSIPLVFLRQIDDIGIWNRALTQQEITSIYTSNLSSQVFAINTIDIYPNPTSSLLNFKSAIQVEKIVIYNMLGQLVQQEKVNASEGTINIEKLVQGTYLVKVNDIDKGYTIIKN